MHKYHCLNPIASVGLDYFTEDYVKTDNIDDAQAILVRSAAMHDMEFSDELLCISRAGAGVNNIPLDRCAEDGIVVFNTPGANANGVKELVLAGMLLASRDIIGGIKWVEENVDDENIGKSAEKAKKAFAGKEIYGKKLGVIGLGAIGVRVANAATHLGMDVYGYDPYVTVDSAWSLSRSIHHVKNVEDIYKECDFITIHVPALDSTKGMINKAAIDMMKEGVIVLNFARNVLVDEEVMVEELAKGKVARYVSDFATPITSGKPGCIVLPHLGASTEESEDNCAKMAVKEVRNYIENGNIKNSVNFPNVDMGVKGDNPRVVVFHRNIPNMIGQFARTFAEENINISDMTNKSKGAYAVTVLDIEGTVSEASLKTINEISEVIKVRVIE